MMKIRYFLKYINETTFCNDFRIKQAVENNQKISIIFVYLWTHLWATNNS